MSKPPYVWIHMDCYILSFSLFWWKIRSKSPCVGILKQCKNVHLLLFFLKIMPNFQYIGILNQWKFLHFFNFYWKNTVKIPICMISNFFVINNDFLNSTENFNIFFHFILVYPKIELFFSKIDKIRSATYREIRFKTQKFQFFQSFLS